MNWPRLSVFVVDFDGEFSKEISSSTMCSNIVNRQQRHLSVDLRKTGLSDVFRRGVISIFAGSLEIGQLTIGHPKLY